MIKIIPKLLIFIVFPFFGWAQSRIDSVKMNKAAVKVIAAPATKVVSAPAAVQPIVNNNAVKPAAQAPAAASAAPATQPAAAPAAATSAAAPAGLFPTNACIFPGHTNDGQILTCYDGYYLTGVTVRFYTGNDNKEYPSSVNIRVMSPSGSSSPGLYLYSNESQGDQRKKEYKSNNMTSVTLETPYVLFNGSNSEYQPWKLWFNDIQSKGLVLEVSYFPNLLTDAWKIDKVEVVFQVKKGSGAPHPVYNNKTITFNTPKLLVSGSGTKNTYIMGVDGSLNAGKAY
ncbi:MAG: hypothetical protein JST68_30540 [Bacteroidetes bacterium]|nr:hypothetical protein [Bacteroidota bacterium]